MHISRRVVVTGGASGIGRSIVEACTARGDIVYVLDIDAAAVASVVAASGAVGWAHCDVSVPESVARAVEESVSRLGDIDQVFHCAGVWLNGPAVTLEPLAIRWLIDVNILGTILVANAFTAVLAAQSHRSHLMITGSEHSLGFTRTQGAAYTATKHAVLGYADVLRRELPANIHLSVLCPGPVSTGLWRAAEHRPERYGGPRAGDEGAAGILAAGMSARHLAAAVLERVEDGEFLILTHGHSIVYARDRWRMVRSAFRRQASRNKQYG